MPPTAAPSAELPKQTLDYIEHEDGSLTAVLTVTFANGHSERYETLVTPDELDTVHGEYVGGEIALGGGTEVGAFGFLKKAFKSIGKVAKAVASSKVFKLAATGLAIASPILGPLGPVALAASAGMGIASKLASGSAAAAAGATQLAASITASAQVDATALTKTAEGAASLLKAANAKRVFAENLPAKKAAAKPKPKLAPAPKLAAAPKPVAAPKLAAAPKPVAAPQQTEAELLARARAGRVRSNEKGTVTDAQLLAAHRAGRIYWVL